jgi:2-polyprenyl-6-hydroxyphenyl methylase / 3-demethylubiquinone-9 3-methyltransferase
MRSANAVDNEMYETMGHTWWDDTASVATLRYFINPIRFAYFQRIIAAQRASGWQPKTVLDVGCGGGFLSEEFAKAGYKVTGVDPAAVSLACAREHAAQSGLSIEYARAPGERLPFDAGAFDIVLCCDVLEHVDDIRPVVREISRVLSGGGIFFYDTINMTLASYFMVIKVMQDWILTAQVESRSHAWRQFVKPCELRNAIALAGLVWQEDRGIAAEGNPISHLAGMRQRVKGKISFRELGERLKFRETGNIRASYMGYAVKDARKKRIRGTI